MYTKVTLTGKIQRGNSPAVGRAVLTPTVNTVSDMDGNVVIYGPLIGILDQQGSFSIEAPATDDPNLRPQNFGYTLKFELNEGVIPGIQEFALPSAQAGIGIDITDILPDPADPTYVPTLQGPPNVLTVGTVTTGAAGSAASVDITGTSPEQVISFVIPQGVKGDKGDKGDPNTLAIGTVDTGAAGTPADATITGIAPNQTLSLVIPQGIQGIQGPQGDPGEVSLQQLNDGLATKLDKVGGIATRPIIKGYSEAASVQSVDHDGTFTVYFGGSDVEAASVYTCNLNSGAGQSVYVVWDSDTNFSAAYAYSSTLIFSDECAVIWPVGTRFAGGTPPEITAETWITAVNVDGVVTVGLAWDGIA